MDEAQILQKIANLENAIAKAQVEIRRCQEDIDELESLCRKLTRAKEEISDIVFDSKKKILRLASLVSHKFLALPTSILGGVEFANIQTGIDSAGNEVKTKIRLIEDEIQQLRNRIGQHQYQITALEGQLSAIRMEA